MSRRNDKAFFKIMEVLTLSAEEDEYTPKRKIPKREPKRKNPEPESTSNLWSFVTGVAVLGAFIWWWRK